MTESDLHRIVEETINEVVLGKKYDTNGYSDKANPYRDIGALGVSKNGHGEPAPYNSLRLGGGRFTDSGFEPSEAQQKHDERAKNRADYYDMLANQTYMGRRHPQLQGVRIKPTNPEWKRR